MKKYILSYHCIFFILSIFLNNVNAFDISSEEIEPFNNNFGKETKYFFKIQSPKNFVIQEDISVSANLLRNGRGSLIYADEQYIITTEIVSEAKFLSEKGFDQENSCDEFKNQITNRYRTIFYDSRTLNPIFYTSSAPNQIEFNKSSGLFSMSYDDIVPNNTYRDIYIALLDINTWQGCSMSFVGPWLRGNEMSWNGNILELRIEWGPMRKTFEVFKFDKPFLKSPVVVRSINTNKENNNYWENKERASIKEQEEFKRIWNYSSSLGGSKIFIGNGMTSSSIAFTDGSNVLNHLDFDTLKYETLKIAEKEIISFGSASNKTMWIISRGTNSLFSVIGKDGKHLSYDCPQSIDLSYSGTEAWSGNYVFNITPEGLAIKFEAPKDKNIIGVDFENREIFVQDEDLYAGKDDIDSWVLRMKPSIYDLDTGKLKIKKCLWVEVGEPMNGAVLNNGNGIGVSPKGWRVSVHHNEYRRVNGLVSTISIHLPSGKTVHYGEGGNGEDIPECGFAKGHEITADNLVALYPCGKDGKAMLLLYDGSKGGQAVTFDSKTLKSREIAHWTGASPLWLAAKHWLFVPRMGYYEVIYIDDQGVGKTVFSLYYSKRDYAVVLPNGFYAGSPGCESLMQYRNETEGMERLARWRNRPGDVLEALGGNPDSVKLLKETTNRWHQKMNFDSSTKEPSSSELPVLKIKKLPPLFASSSLVSIPISVRATARSINQYLLKINGVTKTVPLKKSFAAGQSGDVNCELELSDGTNWIEIRAIDADGIMGDAVRFRLIGQGISPQKTLYLVALGVSSYKDSSLNLRYAAKDAVDFAAAMKKLYGDNIHVLTLTDDGVTRDSLEVIRKFLTNGPKTGDSVILYCAGHGVLDDQWRYVFASHEFDPDDPANTGMLMDDLKKCVASSSARNRLLLMDTCHSGMIGEEDEIKLVKLGANLPKGISLGMVRGMKARAIPQLDAEQKKRYIEEMFSLSSKTEQMMILGASGGGEFAQESGEWNNGVFTRCLIEGLRDKQADANEDGAVNIRELKDYIARKVPEMTRGQQKPSLVSYDPDQEFVIARSLVPPQKKMARVLDMSDDGINPANYIQARAGSGEFQAFDNVEILKGMFADKLDYQYIKGRLASRAEVMADIEEGWSKWPMRSYNLLAAGRNGKTVEVVYSYNLSNYEAKKKTEGFTKETWTLDNHGKIIAWKEQVSRKKAPSLSPEILNAVNDSGRKYSPLEYIECRQNGYVNILAGLFADQVDYQYVKGRKASREDVVKDIAEGFQKWGQRRYEMVAAGKKENVVEVIYSFSLLNPNGPKGKYGFVEPISGYTKETWTLDEQGKIVKWREAISKKEVPSLSHGLFVICL